MCTKDDPKRQASLGKNGLKKTDTDPPHACTRSARQDRVATSTNQEERAKEIIDQAYTRVKQGRSSLHHSTAVTSCRRTSSSLPKPKNRMHQQNSARVPAPHAATPWMHESASFASLLQIGEDMHTCGGDPD
jgi:hypothetical protein